LLKPLILVWKELADTEIDHYNARVLSVLPNLSKVTDVLDFRNKDVFLTLEEAEMVFNTTKDMLEDYSWLGVRSDARGDLLFKAPTKLHCTWHWAQLARFLNYRPSACFIDEDYVGKIKKLAQSCLDGCRGLCLRHRLMFKYRWQMELLELATAEMTQPC